MYEQFVFLKPKKFNKKDVVNQLQLKKVFKNKRTCIFENEELKLSIDKTIVRILLYDKSNQILIEKINQIFKS